MSVENLEAEIATFRAKLAEAECERDRMRGIAMRLNHEIEQILGAALHYPRYCDSPDAFHGATEADGVCVGDHVAETLAEEAAAKIAALTAGRDRYRAALTAYSLWSNWRRFSHDATLREWIGGGEGPDLAEKALAGAKESEAK